MAGEFHDLLYIYIYISNKESIISKDIERINIKGMN